MSAMPDPICQVSAHKGLKLTTIYFRYYNRLPTNDNSYLSYLSLIDTTGWLKETSMTTFLTESSHIKAENYNCNFTKWKYFIGSVNSKIVINLNFYTDLDLPAFSSYFGEVPPPTIATMLERNNISADAILPTTSCPEGKIYSLTIILSQKIQNILNLIQFYSSTCLIFFSNTVLQV